MFDYHVHTLFSADCNIEMSEMIDSAVDKGFSEIAITDHVDYDYPDSGIEFTLNFDDYHNTLEKHYEEYKDRIKVVKGLEIGIQHHIINECNKTVTDYPYDFVICSLHGAERKDLHNGDFFKNRKTKDAYIAYYTYMYDCLTVFKSYNVVGHLNLIDRYKKYITDHVSYKQYSDLVEAILKIIIYDGKGIEINTSSFRYNMDVLTPTIEMLKLYKELSGEIITIGSDAHTPDYIGYQFDYIYEILHQIGFKYITTFDGMKPEFIKI